MGSKLIRKPPRAGTSSEQARGILNSLRLLVRELRVSARDAEKRLGISGAQLFVLQCLGAADVLSMGELAERTHTDQSSVSVVVSRLAEGGLVTRAQSPSDGRRIEVSLTAAGRKVVRAAPPTTQVRLGQALLAMSGPARARLAKGLSELVAQMRIDGSPRMFFEDERAPARRSAKKAPRE